MDKKLRNILILAGILVLLCVGYAAVGLLIPQEESPEEATGADTSAQSAPLFTVTEDGLTALSFTYDADGDGEAELWEYIRSQDGETWSWKEDPTVPLGSSSFYNYSSVLYGITPLKTLTGVTEAELTEMGLATPAKTVTFTDRTGGEQGFCIGAYNTYNGTYCAYKLGDPTTVYLLEKDFYAEFEVDVKSLVYHDDLPAFSPERLVSLTLSQGERTVTVTRVRSEDPSVSTATWLRSVNGEAPVAIASDLTASLEMLVGDMDYLTCYSVRKSDFPAYGLEENTTRMTLVYTKTVEGEEQEVTFELLLGGTDKYGYYYANPTDTPLTMLLGGSVFGKVMTYDDDRIAAGDAAETDTAGADTSAP